MNRILSSLAIVFAVLIAPPAFADVTTYRATMSGPSEAPPNASPAFSVATFIIDDLAMTLSMNVPFFNLRGTTTTAHIHCCTADLLSGIAPPATPELDQFGFPTDVRQGVFNATLSLADPSAFNPGFLLASGGTVEQARAALIQGFAANKAYFNIHSAQFPAGEIRGFIVAVPEPGSWAMMALGLGVLGFIARKKWR
ncbi:CHRD domain-containing protein [Massilia scottii]|uniref:CHRD domain-containing protein n=1 Tax=Massilia scottii TaxID=3057166 RepID=UPI0027964520|nr:CHRD domain-containing protein [Massilia sp. CCM 9029]MDQ1832551.1 CHRD domain-containing protein [Massilia sp. CCM 9029]